MPIGAGSSQPSIRKKNLGKTSRRSACLRVVKHHGSVWQKGLIYDDLEFRRDFTSDSLFEARLKAMTCSSDPAMAMDPQAFHDNSFQTSPVRGARMRGVGRSSFSIMPAPPRPVRNSSFIFGRSDSRIRPLLNQEERDRLHCWAMIVALASSAAGTTLLIMAALR
jgi:hypothetical protein